MSADELARFIIDKMEEVASRPMDVPYIFNEEFLDDVGIDGRVNMRAVAQAILDKLKETPANV